MELEASYVQQEVDLKSISIPDDVKMCHVVDVWKQAVKQLWQKETQQLLQLVVLETLQEQNRFYAVIGCSQLFCYNLRLGSEFAVMLKLLFVYVEIQLGI